MNKNFVIAILSITLMAALIYSFPGIQTSKDSSQLGVHSSVCIYKNNELIAPCSHNTMMNASLNATRDCLGKAAACSAAAYDYIAVGNSSTAENDDLAALPAEITDSGLARAQGTYGLIPQSIGNWSISKVFTSSGAVNLIVNTTALLNASSTGTMFAGKNFASSVTLQSGDQLNVTWYIWVS
ncbi:hypothetical protein A3K64_03575 [Candidatus Micrarchaeota archaeon RBG_16_36_9]|nr:MAG: hypothetical protein A3K64_03575 [Candidatus Micrarchaeota archaeon RBG_16_36_9]